MTIGEILAKVLKGEALSEEEKTFLSEYDEGKLTSAAAANARRRAEQERDEARKELKEYKEKGEKDKTQKETTIAGLNERLKALEQVNADSKAKLLEVDRSRKISEALTGAQIKPIKGVSEKTFAILTKQAFAEVDMDDPTAVSVAIDSFKKDAAGIIEDPSHGGGGRDGDPTPGNPSPVNPWKKETNNLTDQLLMEMENPSQAAKMKAEAGVVDDSTGE